MGAESEDNSSNESLDLSSLFLYSFKPDEVDSNPDYKIYTRRGIQEASGGSIPFVDVFLGHSESSSSSKSEASLRSDTESSFTRIWGTRHPDADLWPAVHRPFCGLQPMPFAPKNTRGFLKRERGGTNYERDCVFSTYSHIRHGWRPGCTAPCAQLYTSLPFVFRNTVRALSGSVLVNATREQLKIGNSVLSEFIAFNN